MYGIWNGITKRFVYGIKEPSKEKAKQKLFEKTGEGAYCWRYEVRLIPDNFTNPPNSLYPRK